MKDNRSIDQCIQDMCDNYCRHQEEYLSNYADPDEAFERMCIEECETCPLNRIRELTEQTNTETGWFDYAEQKPSEKGWYIIHARNGNRMSIKTEVYDGHHFIYSEKRVVRWAFIPNTHHVDEFAKDGGSDG